jgi:Ni,Fe-hydrogenase I large subunit
MAEKIVIDPVTRIEGHLKIEVLVENGQVTDAWTVGTAARGFEILLKGKDPRDATYVTERICGVCAGPHGWTSSVAVENAHGAVLPEAARVIRNLIIGAMWLHNHPLHFYHLAALDYLDVMAVAEYKGNDQKLLAVKDKIVALVKQGDTAPLTPRYEPDEFSVSDPEIVITAVAHYLQALEMQAKARKLSAVFGGKQPHQSSIVAGGVTIKPDAQLIMKFKSMLQEQIKFIKEVYVPDVIAFGTGPLLPLAQAGIGGGEGNFLACGGFPLKDGDYLFKPGVIFDGQLSNVQSLDQSKITEDVKHSWLQDEAAKHPSQMDTVFNLDKEGAYSFLKAPRYEGRSMEVGPLARMLVHQPPAFMDFVQKHQIKIGAVARHAARAFELLMMCDAMEQWIEELVPLLAGKDARIHDTEHWQPPKTGTGYGLLEAPRGALGHWVEIENHKIKSYQMVVPTTWNFAPRDEKGNRGPVEMALLGVSVPDVNNPINIVRVVRSYDPCLSCAVHLIEADSEQIRKYRIC